MQHLLENAESLFEPKMVHRPIDWLVKHRERGQDIKTFSKGGPFITWYSPIRKNHIYMFALDDQITEELS